MKSFDKRLLLYKIEVSEGADAAPVPATDAILTRNLNAGSLEADTKVRQLDGQYFGARPSTQRLIRQPVSFEVEIAGSGVAATPPAWMKLNRVCGFDAGVPGASSVVQSPISVAVPSATLWPYYDNLKLSALGSRGSFTMTFEDDEIPFFAYALAGFPPAGIATEAAPGAPTLDAFKDPLVVSTENTTFSLGEFSPPLRRLTINVGAQTEPRSLTGPQDKILFRNREITFEALIELPDLTAKNYYTTMKSRAPEVLQIIHGTDAGNIVQVDAARAEIGLISLSEEQGAVMATVPGRLLPSAAGDDELIITTK